MTDERTNHVTDESSVSAPLSRRAMLKTTAGAGAAAVGLGAGAVGSVSGGIPTPWLAVDGNTIVTESGGETVKLRGLNIADPKRINITSSARGKDAEQVVRMLTDPNDGWHPRVIRVPTQPIDIGEHTPGHIDGSPDPPAYNASQLQEYFSTHVDPIVDLCEERGVYCIIDMHRHWKPLEWAEGVPTAQDDPAAMVNSDLQGEVMTFWEEVGPRYADRSHVIYEIYNEPTEPGMWADVIERDWCKYVWQAWQAMAQPWIDTIREDADNHIIVGNPGWSTSPEGALYRPFEGGNLSYTYHIYPGHNASMNQNWDGVAISAQGTAAGGENVYDEHPLFVTEFGWDSTIISNYLRGHTSDFGKPFMDFLESNEGISWTAWCADPIWLPKMFELGDWVGDQSFTDSVGDPYNESIPELCSQDQCSWNIMSGENMGQFIKDKLANLKDEDVPSGDTDPITTEPPTTQPPTTEPPESGETPPAWPDGTQPTDPNDDGVFENLNGNDRIDSDDVVVYFENYDQPYMADNAGFYDLNDNGRLDSDDVVVLFESL